MLAVLESEWAQLLLRVLDDLDEDELPVFALAFGEISRTAVEKISNPDLIDDMALSFESLTHLLRKLAQRRREGEDDESGRATP